LIAIAKEQNTEHSSIQEIIPSQVVRTKVKPSRSRPKLS